MDLVSTFVVVHKRREEDVKLSPWAPYWMADRWAYTFGWCLHRLACFVGRHEWVLDPNLRVPFYTGIHEQCLLCGLIKVRPCGKGEDLGSYRATRCASKGEP
jgi:hypothetical protein